MQLESSYNETGTVTLSFDMERDGFCSVVLPTTD
jgi:hypothetical protein